MRSTRIVLTACLALLMAAPGQAHHTAGKLHAQKAWVLAALPGQDQTAGYLVVESQSDDADWLEGVTCDCARTVEVHRMVQAGERMRMEHVERLEVPGHGRIEFKPGGIHLMVFGLLRPLKAGDRVRLTLRFAGAGAVEAEAVVKNVEGGKHDHP